MPSILYIELGKPHIRPRGLLGVCWRQWRTERVLAQRGIRFRSTDPATCAAAYAAMTIDEFDAINGRQAWANWRTIPRALNGRLPDRPLGVVDLGCGAGSSTGVLAWYCPIGTRIIGYEVTSALVEMARQRAYPHHSGATANVQFLCQEVTATLKGPDGQPLPEQCIDLANASGFVGHHLSAQTVKPLIAELRRVLTPVGLAILDVGPTLRARELTRLMTEAGFQLQGRFRACLLDRNGQIVYRKEPR